MEVVMIREDPSKIAHKLRAYKAALERGADSEYERIYRAYQALDKGTPLIRLGRTFHMAGWHDNGLPKLAICRADRKGVSVRVPDRGGIYFNASMNYQAPDDSTLGRIVPMRSMPPRPTGNQYASAKDVAPIIPPDVLSTKRIDLSKRFLLWEANWKEVTNDPMLLAPLGDDLYAVEAAWDLTDVERAILGGRVRS